MQRRERSGLPVARAVLAAFSVIAIPVAAGKTYVVVEPGTHPGIVFSEQELPALRKRAHGDGIAAEAYQRVRELAAQESGIRLTVKEAVGRPGERLARQLEAMALVYQVERDERMGRRAVELFESAATSINPTEFYREVDSDFFATEHWPKAFAFAWDWLYHLMTDGQRGRVLKALEEWNAALYDHTESWWWREASYNCGAIPVGAQGMLLTAIQAETKHPDFERWFSYCFRKIRFNYFPLTWRANGICNEGPGYAHYHKNPTQFAEAVRRTGGADIIPTDGAVNAMHYLRHQWMPQGGCGPVGDNTEYGRRVFQSIYLHGIRELRDRAGLWTFENFTDYQRINPVLIFLFFPDDLEPESPGKLDLRTSYYFEIDRNQAGHVYARSEWDNEEANWFAFVTRHNEANHTHYDMNTFLFTAFGEQFATHANVFPYSSRDHGVDFEHNIVIIDDGGMPAKDRQSAGDDGSINGYLTGVGLGHFADYARGDAHLSYADRSIPESSPAVRAERSVLFAKQGPNPYVVITDEIQKDNAEHDYHWQWYTPAKSISGKGSFAEPFEIDGERASVAIAFADPFAPLQDFRVVHGGRPRRPIELGLLRVNRRGVKARFLAVAAAWREGKPRSKIRRGPTVEGNPRVESLVVESEGFQDLILWQPEEPAKNAPARIRAGELETDALLAMVRTDRDGKVLGYVMGDGTALAFAGTRLAAAPYRSSVSADAKRTVVTGGRRARRALPPMPAAGTFWLPDEDSEVWAGEKPAEDATRAGNSVTIGARSNK